MRRRHFHRAFTLVELLAVMAITAILCTLAYPSYREVAHRTHRLDARLALQRIQYLQERYYAEHLRYAGGLGNDPDVADQLATPLRSESGHYVLSMTAGDDGQTFVAMAAALGSGRQASDTACQKFTVDQAGRKRSADAADNWSGNEVRRCWG